MLNQHNTWKNPKESRVSNNNEIARSLLLFGTFVWIYRGCHCCTQPSDSVVFSGVPGLCEDPRRGEPSSRVAALSQATLLCRFCAGKKPPPHTHTKKRNVQQANRTEKQLQILPRLVHCHWSNVFSCSDFSAERDEVRAALWSHVRVVVVDPYLGGGVSLVGVALHCHMKRTCLTAKDDQKRSFFPSAFVRRHHRHTCVILFISSGVVLKHEATVGAHGYFNRPSFACQIQVTLSAVHQRRLVESVTFVFWKWNCDCLRKMKRKERLQSFPLNSDWLVSKPCSVRTKVQKHFLSPQCTISCLFWRNRLWTAHSN